MDFLSILNTNYEKLKNKETINNLWKELTKEQQFQNQEDNEMTEYAFHYPVDTEDYLQELIEKFLELDKETLSKIDGRLKAYLLTFLYHCTNRSHTRMVNDRTVVLASILYMKLVTVPKIGKLFMEKNLFKMQLYVIIDCLCKKDDDRMVLLLHLKNILLENVGLEVDLLKISVYVFLMGVLTDCNQEMKKINDGSEVTVFCLNALKEIILAEKNENVGEIIITILQFLKSSVLEKALNANASIKAMTLFFKNVILEELEEDQLQFVIDSFCLLCTNEDFIYYDVAAQLLNCMKTQHYKEILHRMSIYTQAKRRKKWLPKLVPLSYAMLKNLPNYPTEKYEVLFQCIIRNVLLLFLDTDKNIVNIAVDVFTQMCCLKNNIIMDHIFAETCSTGRFVNISSGAILIAIIKIADVKWASSSNNEKLLVILSKILLNSRSHNVELTQKALNTICKDFTPYALKHSLPLLHELFCVMSEKCELEIAKTILKIMFKSAMHQDATSQIFADHIFYSLLQPSQINGKTYSSKHYYDLFLTPDFKHEGLFIKCQKLMRKEHIINIIQNLNYNDSKAAVLLSCLLQFYKFMNSTNLVTFFVNNFTEIATREIMGPLSVSLQKILDEPPKSNFDLQQLDVLQSHIGDGISQQIFQLPAVKPAFDLYKRIRDILGLNNEEMLENLFKSTLDKALEKISSSTGDDVTLLYLNEMCLLLKKQLPLEIVNFVNSIITNPDTAKYITNQHPDFMIQLMTILTTVAVVNGDSNNIAIRYLTHVMNVEQQILKIHAYKLLKTLCQEALQDQSDLIQLGFREIVRGDPCLVRICATTLEELIHDDYVVLDAEKFFRFIYNVGCSNLSIFMKDLLSKRFTSSNQNDIAKYYIHIQVFIHMYSRFPRYSIEKHFDEDLVRIKLRMDNPKEIAPFLFQALPIKKRFNILCEIVGILEETINGDCKVDDIFFSLLTDLILTFKLATGRSSTAPTEKLYYSYLCTQIQNQIVNYDSKCRTERFYAEYAEEIRKCTLALLKLLFTENEQILDRILTVLFDSLMFWIEYVKAEIIHYIYVEKGKEYNEYFSKLIQFYKRNKQRLHPAER